MQVLFVVCAAAPLMGQELPLAHFHHLHRFGEDPVSAGEWYVTHWGAKPRGRWPPSREPRFHNGIQLGPSASLMMDDVNIIINPIQYSRQAYPEHWKQGQTAMAPAQGRVVDHAGFSFDNLAEAVEKMRGQGVTVTGEIRSAVFIEGPDRIRIELVEGHATKE